MVNANCLGFSTVSTGAMRRDSGSLPEGFELGAGVEGVDKPGEAGIEIAASETHLAVAAYNGGRGQAGLAENLQMVGNRRFVQVELICNIKAAYGAVGDEPGENIEAGRLGKHIQDSAEQHIISVGLGENRWFHTASVIRHVAVLPATTQSQWLDDLATV